VQVLASRTSTKNAIAGAWHKTEFRARSSAPAPVRCCAISEAVGRGRQGQSEKTPWRKVHASFTEVPGAGGPWDHVARSAYHQFVGV
jgi:hypothetical protein